MVNKKPKSNGPPKAIPKPHHSPHLSAKLSINKSSTILLSSFSPANLHLSLYASVVRGLDAQRLRIHDIPTGRLRCEHIFETGLTCNSISWGELSNDGDKGKKRRKRKRITDSNGVQLDDSAGHTVVAVALSMNKSNILLYSPTESLINGELAGGHIGEVWQFKFINEDGVSKGWSCGADGKLVKWDIQSRSIISTISLPEQSIRTFTILSPTSILCASHTTYLIDPTNPSNPPTKFSASISQIHSLLASNAAQSFLVASDTDRYVNLFSLTQGKQTGALVAESDVKTVSVGWEASPNNLEASGEVAIAAAVTSNGVLELFPWPFASTAPVNSELSRKKHAVTTRKADLKIRIMRPAPNTKNSNNTSSDILSIIDASFQTPDEIIIAWADNGVNVEFEKVKWQERALNPGNGTIDIVKKRISRITGRDVINGAKDMGRTHVDQSETIIISGIDVNMIDANEEEEDHNAEESEASDDEEENIRAEAKDEPSFYDKFQALEVAASTSNNTSKALAKEAPTATNALKPFQGTLTTVLTQALKTNDSALLESCLQTGDGKVILATVRRLDSVYAVTLIERLSERISKRPGRATSLGLWVRWTLVAHGGYLVSLPNLMKTLAGLHATLATRAGALPKLLQLQGRLDMLSAQLELRNELKRGKRIGETGLDLEEEEEQREDGVLYVEGKSADYSSDGEEEQGVRLDGAEGESDEEPEEVGMEGLEIEDASFIKSRIDEDEEDEISDDESEEEDGEEEDDEEEDDEDILDEEEDEDEDEDELRYGGLVDELAEETDDDDEEEDEDGEGGDEDIASHGEDISDEEDIRLNKKLASKGVKTAR